MKPKTPRAQIKALKLELRYWQQIARVEARSLRKSREKIKEIGATMRSIQAAETKGAIT